jgi:uncharacterized protein YndB with AHSA1/START domain
MTVTRSARHTDFVLERRFTAAPARVFHAWADEATKRRWNDCHADSSTFSLDFRVGGRELHRATLPDGQWQVVDKVFLEIVPDARILFAYTIEAGGRLLSASLVTAEFHLTDGGGTRLVLTEQLAYLDGHFDLDQRRHGTAEGLDRLVAQFDG